MFSGLVLHIYGYSSSPPWISIYWLCDFELDWIPSMNVHPWLRLNVVLLDGGYTTRGVPRLPWSPSRFHAVYERTCNTHLRYSALNCVIYWDVVLSATLESESAVMLTTTSDIKLTPPSDFLEELSRYHLVPSTPQIT